MSTIQSEPLPRVGGEQLTPKKGVNLGSKARAAAIKRIQEAHPGEWDKFLKEERVRLGLPELPQGAKLTDEQKKAQKIARLQAQLKELQEA